MLGFTIKSPGLALITVTGMFIYFDDQGSLCDYFYNYLNCHAGE